MYYHYIQLKCLSQVPDLYPAKHLDKGHAPPSCNWLDYRPCENNLVHNCHAALIHVQYRGYVIQSTRRLLTAFVGGYELMILAVQLWHR